jgi:hypothetical protein
MADESRSSDDGGPAIPVGRRRSAATPNAPRRRLVTTHKHLPVVDSTIDLELAALGEYLERFDYPADRDELAAACEGVEIELAGGERNLGELLGDASPDRFESADDAYTAVQNDLPREAVGEPYQSEGEG